MSWLSRLRTRLGHDDPPLTIPDDNESLEVTAILENAKSAYQDSKVHTAEVRRVTTTLAELRTKNHFGESIHLAMMPKGIRG